MIIIGITGSIGMGKTTVSKMLRALKIPVFDSDKEVKEILETNSYVIEKITNIWPDTLSLNKEKKEINKMILSNLVFQNYKERKRLENIVHPLVNKEKKSFLKKNKDFKIVGLDVPLLYETGADKDYDYIFLVNTTKNIQKKRVLMRTNMSETKFNLINKTQWSFEKKVARNPYVVITTFGKLITFFIVLFYLFKILIRGKGDG